MATWLFVVATVLLTAIVAVPFVAALVWAVHRPAAVAWSVFAVGLIGYIPAVSLALLAWVINPMQTALGVTS